MNKKRAFRGGFEQFKHNKLINKPLQTTYFFTKITTTARFYDQKQ